MPVLFPCLLGVRVAKPVFCVSLFFVTLACEAGSAFFDFNTNPTASGALKLYGNANWYSSGGAGASTNASDGYIEVTSSAGGQRGAVVFADFDNGQMVKAFTFEADVRIGNGSAQPGLTFPGFSCRKGIISAIVLARRLRPKDSPLPSHD
jgi:hypothetical protein